MAAAHCATYGHIRISHQSVTESPRASFCLCSPWQGVVCAALVLFPPCAFIPKWMCRWLGSSFQSALSHLKPWIILKRKSFYWPVLAINITLHALLLPGNYCWLLLIRFFVLPCASIRSSICILEMFMFFLDCADFNNGVSALVVCGSQPPKMEMEIWINLKGLCQEDCYLHIKRNIFHIYLCVKLEFIVIAVNCSDTVPRPLHIVFIRILGCVNCSRFTSKKHDLFMRDSSWPGYPEARSNLKWVVVLHLHWLCHSCWKKS